MKVKVLPVLAAMLFLLQAGFGQATGSSYTIGPGDMVAVKVLGEPQFDFETAVDEEGRIEVPFVKESLVARCRTERDLREEVAKKLSVYLRNPQVNLRITDRKSRPPVVLTGEVNVPGQVTLIRKTTLIELLAFAGGPKEKSGGMVQVYRTRPPMCAESTGTDWKAQNDDSLTIPSRLYSLGSLKMGGEESNPQIFPGDLVVVAKGAPVYVIGEVMAIKEINMGEKGLSLSEAIAQAGGISREARTKDIKIRRLKANSREREIIAVNFDLIRKGEQKDVMLEPEDIVEVNKAKKSVAQTVLELVTGAGRNFSQVLPQRILY